MIRCVQIGRSTVQGELVKSWIVPARKPPLYELEMIEMAVVEVFGQEFVGRLIRSERQDIRDG